MQEDSGFPPHPRLRNSLSTVQLGVPVWAESSDKSWCLGNLPNWPHLQSRVDVTSLLTDRGQDLLSLQEGPLNGPAWPISSYHPLLLARALWWQVGFTWRMKLGPAGREPGTQAMWFHVTWGKHRLQDCSLMLPWNSEKGLWDLNWLKLGFPLWLSW